MFVRNKNFKVTFLSSPLLFPGLFNTFYALGSVQFVINNQNCSDTSWHILPLMSEVYACCEL